MTRGARPLLATVCRVLGMLLAALVVELTGAAVVFAAPNSPDTEWRLIGRDAGQQHFSPLQQISDQNVSTLGLAWYTDMPTKMGLVGVPLVADGVIYQSGSHSIIYANDVSSGKLLWSFDPRVHFPGDFYTAWGAHRNRGLALHDDKVIVATGDCRLVAVSRRNGSLAWDAPVCDPGDGYTITAAPRVGAGKIFVAPANEDTGTRRGYVEAHDAATGKRLWRFYLIPGDPALGFENAATERAAKTWGKDYWKNTGGGCAWDSMTYDPQTHLLYVGTGGPTPWNPNERGGGRGDELFTNSIVALNADTGAFVWHYQVTPDDAWNLEATMPIMTADLPLSGGSRHVVMEAPKNGFFYVLDARTGALISAEKYVPVNWASHVDMKTGRPIELAAARYYANGTGTAVVQPTSNGAHDWRPMSYSPVTGLVYLPANESATKLSVSSAQGFLGGKLDFVEIGPSRGSLIGWDPVRQRQRWKQPLETQGNGGVLSTAGNLVFQGTATGELDAYRADTGKRLWSMAVKSPIAGTPITVEVGGRQTIFVYTGEYVAGPVRLLAFQLGGTARLPDTQPVPPFPQPPLPRPEPTLADRGRALFERRGCSICHGVGAQMDGADASAPDLRRASAETHQMFAGIVLGGLRREKGMPVFAGKVSTEDLAAIEAFIIDQAWQAYTAQATPAQANH